VPRDRGVAIVALESSIASPCLFTILFWKLRQSLPLLSQASKKALSLYARLKELGNKMMLLLPVGFVNSKNY